jgi:hypothetical protein
LTAVTNRNLAKQPLVSPQLLHCNWKDLNFVYRQAVWRVMNIEHTSRLLSNCSDWIFLVFVAGQATSQSCKAAVGIATEIAS